MNQIMQNKLLPLQLAAVALTILIYPCQTKSIYELLASPDESIQSPRLPRPDGAANKESDRLESAIQSYVILEEAYLRGYIAALKDHQVSSNDEETSVQTSIAELLHSSGSRLSKRSRSDYLLDDPDEEPLWLDRSGRIRRRRRDSHPVYLGFGQEAAGAAYDTFASILEEEAGKRIEKNNRPSSNPVRFIG